MEEEENHRKASGDDDDASARPHPYYGCTFCRRGFSNAQALGGHMNIHRKDRAKAQPPPPPPAPAVSSSMEAYGCHTALAPSAERTTVHRLFGEDLGLGLRGNSTGGYRRHRDATGEVRRQEVDEDGEVDLELRLGHQPPDKNHTA